MPDLEPGQPAPPSLAPEADPAFVREPAPEPVRPPPAPPPPAVVAAPEPVRAFLPAFAVLTAPLGNLVAGQVVAGVAASIDALIATNGARAPTGDEVERAAPFINPLPAA